VCHRQRRDRKLDCRRKVQQVAPGVREPGVQTVDMLLDVGLLGPEHGENERLGHDPEIGLDRLEGLWRLRHNTGPWPAPPVQPILPAIATSAS